MGFISFNLNYYKNKIEYYEGHGIDKKDLLEAKRLLKMIYDLLDEGYDDLYNALQIEYRGVDRLEKALRDRKEEPFQILTSNRRDCEYRNESIELKRYINDLIYKSLYIKKSEENYYIDEIINFCKSIKYENDCAYVFLLRDVFLPYIYFKKHYEYNTYPWIISRSLFNLMYERDFDDIIRTIIFDAREKFSENFEKFSNYCKKEIRIRIENYPYIKKAIQNLLSLIECKKILVIESGCNGTFPMLLSALDDRVDFKMYTTAPYFVQIYEDHIYTTAYENLRAVETLTCHDQLFLLREFKNNNFYVSENKDEVIVQRALSEISYCMQV